jgi:hypothetical protein
LFQGKEREREFTATSNLLPPPPRGLTSRDALSIHPPATARVFLFCQMVGDFGVTVTVLTSSPSQLDWTDLSSAR